MVDYVFKQSDLAIREMTFGVSTMRFICTVMKQERFLNQINASFKNSILC